MKKDHQTKNIMNFIRSLGEKNYAQANKSLQKTIENKIFDKLCQHKDINIFKR